MSEWKLSEHTEIWKNNKLCRACVVSFLVYLFFRYVFTLIAPFALAFVLITLCYPILQKLQHRIPIRKKFLAVGIIVPLLLLLMGLLWAAMVLGIEQLDVLPAFCTRLGDRLELFFHQCCGRLDGKFGWDGEEIEHYMIEQMTVVMENVQIQVVPQILTSSYSCFKSVISVIGFLAITCIAAFLLEKDYTALVEGLQSSEELRFVWKVFQGVLSYIITFIKAQGVILAIISILCSVTLCVMGVEGGIGFGLLAGFLDMLPFIGTGIVLVPLAVWELLNGRYVQMAVCIVLYGGCVLVRELAEPKLIGKRLGIAPALMLLAVYAGIRLFGVSGILKGPLALIVIYEILKTGFDERRE